VVDDDKLTRMLMSRLLQRLGHHAHAVADGFAAISRLVNMESAKGKVAIISSCQV